MALVAALLLSDAPSRKDAVIADVGASAAFAGLVLVFLGVLVTAYQDLVGRAAETTLGRFKTAARSALWVFFWALGNLVVGVVWLVVGEGHALYIVTIASFLAEVVLLALLAWYSTMHVLLKG